MKNKNRTGCHALAWKTNIRKMSGKVIGFILSLCICYKQQGKNTTKPLERHKGNHNETNERNKKKNNINAIKIEKKEEKCGSCSAIATQ